MDYCSSCRRHLNGALVCPGCGAYAPDIAPPTAMRPSAPATGTAAARTAARQFGSSGRRHDGGLRDEHMRGPDGEHMRGLHGEHIGGLPGETAALAGRDEAPRSGPSGDVDGAPPASPGRAARRRQLARWKKNKRRAAVATAVALVGGGLTMTALDRHSADRAQAATAPDNRPMGVTGEQTGEEGRPDPATAPPGARRSSPAPRSTSTKSPAQPAATGVTHRRSTVTTPRTVTPDTRPDAAATSLPVKTSIAGGQAAAPASGGTNGSGTGTTAQQPSTPPPSSAPANTGGSNSGTSQTNPAPAATSPAHLCVLVVCLG
ncbi:SCO2400 family protein [Streptomyces sp. NPDC003710]